MNKSWSTLFFCLATISILPISVSAFAPGSSVAPSSRNPLSCRIPRKDSVDQLRINYLAGTLSMGDNNEDSMSSPTTNDASSNPSQPIWEQALIKIGSTTSKVVAGTFYIVLAYKRDALMVSFFIGSITNGILSKVLKKVLNQERPAGLAAADLDLAPSDNGMPSSHAMSLGFICTFTALQVPWTALPLLVYASISLIYRVHSNLHTVEQVFVGVIIGSSNGAIWRSLCLGENNPFGVSIMEWVVGSFLNDQGLLPWHSLALPALVGVAIVGSVERRIARFFESKEDAKNE